MDKTSTFRRNDNCPTLRPDADRYFKLDNDWYFSTREGVVMGPYHSRAEAIGETKTYIDFILSIRGPISAIFRRQYLSHPEN